jgi:anti-sigma factor RsiW
MFVDGELEPGAAGETKAHLQECAQCRELVRRLEAENAGIKTAFSTPTAVPDIASIVMDRLETAPEQRRPMALWKRRRVLTAAAGLLVAAVLLFYMFFNAGNPTLASENEIILCTANVEGKPAQSHIYQSEEEPDVQFIWLEQE